MHGRCRQRHRLRVDDLPLDQQASLQRAVGRFTQCLQLQVGVLDRLQVALQLGRQLPGVPPAVVLELLFLLDEALLRCLELGAEELAGGFRLGSAVGEVLVDVERRQPFGHPARGLGVIADVAHPKRIRLPPGQGDVTSARMRWTTSSITWRARSSLYRSISWMIRSRRERLRI
jgi:hypothetical protein